MHVLNPGGGGSTGKQADRESSTCGILTSHPSANVSQCREVTFAAAGGPDAHPFSVIVIGAIVRE
jgi:hypothetical protein